MLEDIENKRVLVTGASGGIGAGIAKAFGQLRARVLVHYRTRRQGAENTVAKIKECGGEALMFQADLRADHKVQQLVDFATERWDGLDVLINNAGVVLKSSVLDTASKHWDDTFQINARAPFLLSRHVAKLMIRRGIRGCILNNSSVHATNSTQYFCAYAASKAALESMSKVMALEWAPHGIRVNCIAPGVVPVERTAEVLQNNADSWMPHIPVGRFGTPRDIANLCVYLCSDKASWITGQTYVVDGGMLARLDILRRPHPPVPPDPDPVEE